MANYFDVIAKREPDLYDFYRVRIRVEHLVGGVPKDPEMVQAWIGATCKEASADERAKIVKADLAALPDVVEDELSATGTTFLVDKSAEKRGLYIEGRQVKSMLKEAANIMKNSVPSKKKDGELGVAGLKSKMADHVFVEEEFVYLGRQKVDRTVQRPIHIEDGPRGPRNAIKVSDILDNVELEFSVRKLRKGEVTEEALYLCLHYAENVGLGADRSQGFGKFKVLDVQPMTLEQIHELQAQRRKVA